MVQAALFLLIAMVALGVFGKWRRPAVPKKRDPLVESAERCAACGDYVLGRAESCRRTDCPNR